MEKEEPPKGKINDHGDKYRGAPFLGNLHEAYSGKFLTFGVGGIKLLLSLISECNWPVTATCFPFFLFLLKD